MENNFKQKILEEIAFSSKTPKINWEDAIKNAMREEVEAAVNKVLKSELTSYLGFEKNEQGKAKEKGNSRNGKFERELNTTFGPIHVEVPRDRQSDFKTKLFEPYKRSTQNIAETVLKLYNANMTESEISDIIDALYKHKYAKSTISNITDVVLEDVKNFKERKIKKKYFALFMDATYIPLRRNTVEKESINIVLGIDLEGHPEILGYSISPSESKESWEELLKSLKARGLETAQILISDGFIGIDELIKTYLPGCLQQRCYLHIVRNLKDKVRKYDQGIVANEFMKLARYETLEEALKKFKEFVDIWGSKYKSINEWAGCIDIMTLFNFYHFPYMLRKSIYTNNRIESFNKEIKRNAKAHVMFSTEEAEEKFLVTLFNRHNLGVSKNRIGGYELINKR